LEVLAQTREVVQVSSRNNILDTEKPYMKKLCFNTAFAFVCLFTATALPSFAQSSTKLDFTAPFPFMVGNVVLPAGTYHIATNSEGGAMFVSNNGSLKSAAAIAYAAHTSEIASKASVGFVRRGDQYFLHSVGLETGQTYELADRFQGTKKITSR
jgi:hypothetical protein